ncbi:MAG: hypothetical protein J7K75_03730 [Desulfuromonas sp.]|nr:hypothetical protein [Desulfuromonas sp.]
MRHHTLFLLATVVLVSSFTSTSFAKDRDRDNRHDKKIHIVEQIVQDRHHGNNYRSDHHHQKQLKIAKQQRRIAKQQRKIIKQQRKIAKLQQRRHQQRLARHYYNDSNYRQREHRDYRRWATNNHNPLRHSYPQVVIPVPLPPLPRIVLHFPW